MSNNILFQKQEEKYEENYKAIKGRKEEEEKDEEEAEGKEGFLFLLLLHACSGSGVEAKAAGLLKALKGTAS